MKNDKQVLRMIADGKITPEEGSRLLAALSGGTPAELAAPAASTEQAQAAPEAEQAGAQQQAYTPEQEVVSPPPPILLEQIRGFIIEKHKT